MFLWTAGALLVLWIVKQVLYRLWPRKIKVPYEIRITSLNVYPVKALRGHTLNKTELACTGLLHDRRFVIASIPSVQDGGNNTTCRFESQRTYPLMATITPYILTQRAYDSVQRMTNESEDKNFLAADFNTLFSSEFPPVPLTSGHEDEPVALLLACDRQTNPRMRNRIDVPDWLLLEFPSSQHVKESSIRRVRVWDTIIPGAVDMGDAASDWLSMVLGPSNAELEAAEEAGVPTDLTSVTANTLRLLRQDPSFAPSVRKNPVVPRLTPFPWLHPNAKNLKPPPQPPRECFSSVLEAAMSRVSYTFTRALSFVLPYLIPYPLHIRLWRLAVNIDSKASCADGGPLLVATEESLQYLNDMAKERASERILTRLLAEKNAGSRQGGSTNGKEKEEEEIEQKQRDAILRSAEFQEALQAELQRINLPFPMRRFRPNIVVSQSPTAPPAAPPTAPTSVGAWNEDRWQELVLGDTGTRLIGSNRCARCVVTTLNPSTGTRNPPAHAKEEKKREKVMEEEEEVPEEDGENPAVALLREPLATLAEIRASYWGAKEGVYFGLDMVPRGLWGAQTVPIQVGERLDVLKLGPISPY